MLSKTRFMLKVMMHKLNGCISWDDDLLEKQDYHSDLT